MMMVCMKRVHAELSALARVNGEAGKTEHVFSTSPSAKLLRSPHAAHIVYFLNLQFKAGGAVTIVHSELVRRAAEFQESIHALEPDELSDRPDTYVTKWSTGNVTAQRSRVPMSGSALKSSAVMFMT